jgi:signal transduction histidine kinase
MVSIQALQAGDKPYALESGLVLPKLTRNLRFDYTAPSLTSPQRVHFRYRLEGADAEWQDAGTRRQAFYTNLDPGAYRFRVRAVNEDGTWSANDAVFDFRIAPAFYQTLWFKALLCCFALALLWLLYLLRLRQLAARAGIRTAERERIARDLHDTLLQGIQGLQLRLQTWAADPLLEAPHREEMNKAARCTHDLLVDGRDRIVALRRSGSTQAGVASSLKEIGCDYASLYPARFSVCEDGEPRVVTPDVAAEVIDIVREGLRNAFVHARADHIGLVVAWRRRGLEITVDDDGCGIDEAILCEGRRAGHWGLVGMRERAHRIGGRFVIERGKARGTGLRLGVPARIAYAGSRWWFWRHLGGTRC